MSSSFLSVQLKRTGGILQRGASDQIADYPRRFNSIKDVYDGLLRSLIRRGFSVEDAAATARDFFGSEKVRFAAVDGTAYTQPMFDLVIFFGGSYAAKAAVETLASSLALRWMGARLMTTIWPTTGIGL